MVAEKEGRGTSRISSEQRTGFSFGSKSSIFELQWRRHGKCFLPRDSPSKHEELVLQHGNLMHFRTEFATDEKDMSIKFQQKSTKSHFMSLFQCVCDMMKNL